MENFNYNLIIKSNGNEIVIKTNDVSYAIREYLRADDAGCDVCLCNGYTGEVLCHNGDEPYCTDEMALMILGFMCAEAWGEDDEDEEPAEEEDNDYPTCGMCGGDVVDGVCNCCGRRVEPYTERIPCIGEVVNALFKEMADGMGIEVIPLSPPEGLPS